MFELRIQEVSNNFRRSFRLLKIGGSWEKYVYGSGSRFLWSKAGDDECKEKNDFDKLGKNPTNYGLGLGKYDTGEDNLSIYSNKWRPEIAWLAKALDPALQLFKRVLPAGNENVNKPPSPDISLREIFASIQRSKLGIQDWSLSDLTVGLYLIYLQQASTYAMEIVKGELISSEAIVQDLIYHIELAKGAYKDNASGLARHSMLRENNTVKFIKNSSVLRPGYYIGIDTRKKLVILGIRGTHTVFDLITDFISSSLEEITFEGYSTHFGTAEAARWFLTYEIDTLRKCLENHKGFKLRLVGHSLGGACASLLAIMIRNKSFKDLGFDPNIVSAVGYATPPCVSKELAESCSDFVTTVVMQDDIIPRLNKASLTRLRNEILETDWVTVLKREDWKSVVDLVTNAKQVLSSVHGVARKIAEYAKFRGQTEYSGVDKKKGILEVSSSLGRPSHHNNSSSDHVHDGKHTCKSADDLFVPGTLYYIKRNTSAVGHDKHDEYFTLLRRHPCEHFQRILLSSNIISDHKCDSHFYALRDILKGLPPPDERVF